MCKDTKLYVGLLAVLFLLLTVPAFAGDAVNITSGAVLVEGKPAPGLAAHGYDVVAYFTQSKPVKGDAKYATAYNGATYRFSSAGNLAAFKSNPSKYEPAYGGYCAFGVSVGAKFDGDPQYWKIVDGKLYLNLAADIQQKWLEDVPGNIRKANANWSTLKNKRTADSQ
jgi:YHS domain-containing protein